MTTSKNSLLITPQIAHSYYTYLYATFQKKLPKVELIVEMTQLYHELLMQLTENQPQVFSSDYERSVVVMDQFDLPEGLEKNLRIWGYVSTQVNNNKQKEDDLDYGDLQQGILTLSHLIAHFSETAVPTVLEEIYEDFHADAKKIPVFVKVEHIDYLQGMVLEIGELQTAKNDRRYFQLTCASQEYGKVNIYLWEEFTYLHSLVWEYARIHFTHLDIEESSFQTTEPIYAISRESLVTLDPDFLIDATSMANCSLREGVNALMMILAKFAGTPTNYYFMRGSIVNNYLDEVMSGNPAPPLMDLFSEYIQNKPTYSLIFTNDDYKKLRLETEYHFATLQTKAVQQLRTKELSFEPTFLSDKFGIRGRLDMLVSYADEPNRKDVIELKTSKDPLQRGRNVDYKDSLQAVAYNLLLDTIDPKHTGVSYILYSSSLKDQNPLRNVPNDVPSKRRLLKLRNAMVTYEYQLSNHPQQVIQLLRLESFMQQSLWETEKNKIRNFRQTLDSSQTLELTYFYEFVGFIAREHRTAKIGERQGKGNNGFAALWNKPLKVKEQEYGVLAFLQYTHIEETDAGIVEVHFNKTENTLEVSRFRVGDFVLLYPQESDGSLQPTRHQILKATIKKVGKDRLAFSPVNVHVKGDHFAVHDFWAVETESTNMSYDAMYQLLQQFLNLMPFKKELLLGTRQPRFGELPDISFPELKESQNKLVQKALAAKDYFLLQGPPGTGKTKVMLKNLVEQLLKDPKEKILLLAFTNRAVDEMCAAIKEIPDTPKFFRLGFAHSTEHPDVVLSKFAKANSLKVLKESIESCRVFITTVLTYQRSSELRHFLEVKKGTNSAVQGDKFKITAIVDEASQLLEPQIVGILGNTDKFILIGDEKQLPAIVLQNADTSVTDKEILHEIELKRLSDSLFERLVKRCKKMGWLDAYGMLDYQGRMHEQIVAFPNQYFYNGELKNFLPEQEAAIPDYLENIEGAPKFLKILQLHRSIFIKTNTEPERNRNVQEAKTVKWLLNQLAPLFAPEDLKDAIGVITPYRSQIAEIRRQLDDEDYQDITVDTVERYQGGQKRIIIVSFAVNDFSQLRYLPVLNEDKTVDKRLNVTLTRAQDHLILIGNTDVLEHSPIYRQLVEHYKGRNLVFAVPKSVG
ncbi:MAG: AAA domain-containing protein [Chitinophagales bacterium]